jgi:hypothetical protein
VQVLRNSGGRVLAIRRMTCAQCTCQGGWHSCTRKIRLAATSGATESRPNDVFLRIVPPQHHHGRLSQADASTDDISKRSLLRVHDHELDGRQANNELLANPFPWDGSRFSQNLSGQVTRGVGVVQPEVTISIGYTHYIVPALNNNGRRSVAPG